MEWREALEEMRPWILPILTAIVSWWLYRRKYEAEVNDVFIESASKVVAMYEKTFEEWKCRVKKLEDQKNALENRIKELEDDYRRKYAQAQRRMKLLARVVVRILEYSNGGDPCIEQFISNVETVTEEDRRFLHRIIDEVNHGS